MHVALDARRRRKALSGGSFALDENVARRYLVAGEVTCAAAMAQSPSAALAIERRRSAGDIIRGRRGMRGSTLRRGGGGGNAHREINLH